ncbi:MAG: hypothetical protein J5685_11030 [Clostridiales bacterium]|nr:hypothetical protein [Clostridiales bacterium]
MRIEEGGDRVFLLDQSRVERLPDDICVGTNRSGVPYYWWITSSDGYSLGPAFSERYIRDRAGSGGRGENGSNVLIGVRPAIWISPD